MVMSNLMYLWKYSNTNAQALFISACMTENAIAYAY